MRDIWKLCAPLLQIFVNLKVVQNKNMILHERIPVQPHSKINPQIFTGFLCTKDMLGSMDIPVKLIWLFPWIFIVK